jgi:hypothetical protein
MAYTSTAKGLAALGRGGDNTLMHVGKNELAGLQHVLGRELTVNPETGLLEAFSLSDILVPLGIGLAAAATGGAGAAALGGGALTSTAIGATTGGLTQGAINKMQGKDFGAGFAGGALTGGISGYGAADLAGGPMGAATPAAQLPAPANFSNTVPSNLLTKAGVPAPAMQAPVGPMSPVTPKPIVPTPETPSFTDALTKQGSAMLKNAGDLIKPIGMGAMLGSGITSAMNESAVNAQNLRQQKLARQQAEQEQQQYFSSLGYPLQPLSNLTSQSPNEQRGNTLDIIRGYAEGGTTDLRRVVGGVPIKTSIPAQHIDTFANADLNNELKKFQGIKSFAQGALVNATPAPEEGMHPLSMVPQARPQLGATPVKREVVGYDEGGLLDGPGDGMSDDIPASIEDKEEVRVADGEFVIPPEIVRMIGDGDPEKGAKLLDQLLPLVRQAAHGKKEQVSQDAGKLAAQKFMQRAMKGNPDAESTKSSPAG